uniref:Uncharacterized protein n=1 Tax=Lepeophtheirus salmonis TaxID=72036 RepID=A0A0K2TXA7_LEPSM
MFSLLFNYNIVRSITIYKLQLVQNCKLYVFIGAHTVEPKRLKF